MYFDSSSFFYFRFGVLTVNPFICQKMGNITLNILLFYCRTVKDIVLRGLIVTLHSDLSERERERENLSRTRESVLVLSPIIDAEHFK